jgi:hypothetical protein
MGTVGPETGDASGTCGSAGEHYDQDSEISLEHDEGLAKGIVRM